jgi:type VI secretion system protein ImpK
MLALLAVYLGLAFSLGAASDPVFARIVALRPPAPAPTQVVVAAPAAQPRLAGFLQPEIQAELVVVRDLADRSFVVLRGEGLFDSGSATLRADREVLIRRIAEALGRVPGTVIVTGHTDNVQSRSLQFPSNWHLSEARAASVRTLLQNDGLPAARLQARGKGEAEPIVPNDSAANRARNRRVEIELLVAGTKAGG